ncbi:MAG: hypothetical protein M1828_005736 [Chrysothrix sp. TS-e1954]|nr:MAG: hypothetical protein M1828_005736 [Chrysothrix sp. TS-e1954]
MPQPHPSERPPPSPDETTSLLPQDGSQIQHAQSTDNAKKKPLTASSQPHQDDTAPEPASAQESEPHLTTARLLLTMSGIYIAAFLAALDSTLVATLAAPISSSFSSLTLLSWLASAFFIASTVSQPLVGKLTDIYGRRAGMLVLVAVFAVGNTMSALAQSEGLMIAGRVVAGLGGGGCAPIAAFVIGDLVPLRRRGVWQGITNIMFGTGSSVGGPLGGWLNDWLGWRAAFWVQVPPTLLSLGLVWFFLEVPKPEEELDSGWEGQKSRLKRVDFAGAVLLTVTLLLFLTGLNTGGNILPWTHPLVLTSLPLSALLFAAFIYVELRLASEPVIPVKLLADRGVLAPCLELWFATMARFGVFFYAPIWFLAQGYSATATGLRFIPESAAIATTSLAVGLAMKKTGRYWWLNAGVMAVFALAIGAVALFFVRDMRVWAPFVIFFLLGAGYAGALTTTLMAFTAAVEQRDQAVVTSTSYAFRATGSTISIAFSGAIFQNLLGRELRMRLGKEKGAREWIPRVRDGLDVIGQLPKEAWRVQAIESYVSALRGVFTVLFGVAVLGWLCALACRENRLHKTMGRRDE